MRNPPSTDRGRATLERIREAACVLFARQGVRATSLDQVEALARAGRSQVYHLYRGKADLVADVVSLQVDRVLEAQQPLLSELATPDDVREWCRLAVELHRDSEDPIRCPIGTLVQELGEDAPEARAALADGFARWLAALTAGLQRVEAAGGLRAGADPVDVAVGLLAAYQGGVLLASIHADVDPLERALHGVTRAALRSSGRRGA